MVEKLPVRWIENDVDGVGLGPVRKSFAGENDRVTCVADLGPFFAAVFGFVPDLGIDEGTGILQERRFQIGDIWASVLCSQEIGKHH